MQVEPVERGGLPNLLQGSRNGCAIADGEYHFGRSSRNDLMHHKGGQVVEQMRVVDTDDHRRTLVAGGQRLDHPAEQADRIGDT